MIYYSSGMHLFSEQGLGVIHDNINFDHYLYKI